MSSAPAKPLDRRDAVLLCCWLPALLLACLYLTRGREFWSDELFGWYLLHDPSLPHMTAAWKHGADGGGLLFYLLGRLWMSFFGPSAMALRLFNLLGMQIAFVFTWIAARRWYRLGIVAFALPFCWLTAHPILRQLMVGRFYGWLLAATAFAFLAYAIAATTTDARPTLLAVTFLAHTLLVGIHPFGLIYSVAALAATLLLDIASRRWRPKLYLAIIGGWWPLWPSWTALKASRDVGRPHFWTTTPTLQDLHSALVFDTMEIQWLLFLLLPCLLILSLRRRRSTPPQTRPPDRAALFFASTTLLVIPALWVISLHGTSLFVDRYLTPAIIGLALLFCAMLERLLLVPGTPGIARLAPAVAALIAFAGTAHGILIVVPAIYPVPPHPYTAAMAALLPRNAPIVVERVDLFAEAVHAQPQLQLRYLLDWQTSLLPESPRGDVSGYHEMENWRASGYNAGSIQDSTSFLAHSSEFWVVADASELWLSRRVLSDPAFKADAIASFRRERDTETIWRVRRQALPEPSTPPPSP